jgi:hypothetical protein
MCSVIASDSVSTSSPSRIAGIWPCGFTARNSGEAVVIPAVTASRRIGLHAGRIWITGTCS